MLGLPRTRGFSAGNWQILLTNNTLNAALLIGVVYMGLTFFGAQEAAGSYIALPVMYASGASTFFLPIALILLLIRSGRKAGGAMLYLISSSWLIWLWLFAFTFLYQKLGTWVALLGVALSLVSSGKGLFVVFALVALVNGMWSALLVILGAVVLCRVVSNAGKSFMGLRPSESLRRWILAEDVPFVDGYTDDPHTYQSL